jgi:phosphoribosylanthranilate isomerase
MLAARDVVAMFLPRENCTMDLLFRIKICGVTNQRDAAFVADSGADAIGLNFFSRSPRRVSVRTARQIVGELPRSIRRVGVFVNSPMSEVNEIANAVGLDLVQLHGDETVEQMCEIEAARVIKAIRCRRDSRQESQSIQDLETQCRARECPIVAILLDAFVAGEFGGTGNQVDWQAAARIRASLSLPLILAGGLTSGNVANAIRSVSPVGVDVASGVESAPGKKDEESVREFVAQARTAFGELMP